MHMPSYKRSNPTPQTTLLELRWPLCAGKHTSILGSFCVPPTTPEMEKKPKTMLPRLSIDVAAAGEQELTIFLLNDEDDSMTRLKRDSFENKSCSSIAEYAEVVVPPTPGSNKVSTSRSLTGSQAHMWFVVAVDCKTRVCPNVTSANITFFHPNSDGSREVCTSDAISLEVMRAAMVEGWQALSIRNVLNISGVTPLGVVVLYLIFSLATIASILLAVKSKGEADLSKRELLHAAFYLSTILAICYLTMATGNGLAVLRKVGSGSSKWAYSNAVMATPGDHKHPNPFYDEAYARARTYPFFYARQVEWLLTSWISLHFLSDVVGAPPASRQAVLFCATLRVLCDFAATSVTGGARWVFWVLECLFLLACILELNAFKHLAMRRSKHVTSSYQRIRHALCGGWATQAVLWIPCAGTKGFSGDADVVLYGLVDAASVGIVAVTLAFGAHVHGVSLRSSSG
eukprot:CAMPEP_0181334238 /NCGR_PEP_ID=MMETSP1101-20121128/26136_1 /TAXON_ID=46948 /ORGANISM="Rhodomonas abbreviata, Strain Caron Lab Isolate" /LENGTH=457 /DNA_ID=CAMNT_0023444167 /DNA_START=276 /DNA_END=1645 /DNA_ORIENTATION=-